MKASQQLLRFMLVSGANSLVGYSLYASFIYIGLGYSIALLLATMLGVLFNFRTTGKFVFMNTQTNLLFKFIAVYAFVYLLQNLAILLIQVEVNDLYLAGFIIMLPAALITFILNKWIVFRKDYETN